MTLSRIQLCGLMSAAMAVFCLSALLVVMLFSTKEDGFDPYGVGKALQASPSASPLSGTGSSIIDIGGGMPAVVEFSSINTQVTKLQEENERLRGMLKRAIEFQVVPKVTEGVRRTGGGRAGGGGKDGAYVSQALKEFGQSDSDICIDMVEFLGTVGYYTGVSYDPKVCFPSVNTSFHKSGPEAVSNAIARAKRDLVVELAKIKGVDPSLIEGKTDKMFHELGVGTKKYPEVLHEAMKMLPNDPDFLRWRDTISVVLARYLADPDGNLYITCPGTPMPADVNKLGTYCTDNPTRSVIEKFGYYIAPFESIDSIASLGLVHGMCTTHVRDFRRSYADWLKKDRMNEKWRTFNAPTLAADHVLLMFDMLYEQQLVFTRQFWMGVITMQNPFDMYSIQDIIYTVKPDLLIETGTASGGSALLWAGIMELADLEESKIITVDLNLPGVWNDEKTGTAWKQNPTENKLWKKRVEFMQGHTVDPMITSKIIARAKSVQTVLVTLDSGHDLEHVQAEMEVFCPLVTVGSYCIVEDTKMSRWHSTGPLGAVKMFLEKHPEFEVDRGRELLYTHHASGYLKRIA